MSTITIEWDASSFQEGRKRAIAVVASEFSNAIIMHTEAVQIEKSSTLHHPDHHTTAKLSGKQSIVIVDDIMYLRSMRREIYVLARDRDIPLLVVWVNTSPEIAQQRNTTRDHNTRVSEESMTRIISDFEVPDSTAVCDRYNLTVCGDTEER